MSVRLPSSALTRRDVLASATAAALLAACGEKVAGTDALADAATPESDAQLDAPTDTASDIAADAAQDASAVDAAADATAEAADVAPDATPPTPLQATITPNEKFYVTSCCSTPQMDAATWSMTVSDRGKLLATWTLDYLESLKPRDKEHTLECIGGGPAYQLLSNAIWTGLPLLEIFAASGITVPSDISEMKIVGLDDFGTGLPTADLALPIWLVWRVNGQPLPPEHGFPVRMLVPNRYGMKNPKWMKSIEFVDQPFIGFWESKGWSKTAYYRPNAYIRSHAPSSQQKAGKQLAFGTAFAGRDAVVKVDCRIDGGTWQPAILDYTGVQDVWTLWHFGFELTPGVHTLQARCTTASGAQSEENPEGTDGLSGYNGSMAISFVVA